ncbi:MAG: beta-ketoacyl-[acyl-carrier-protein] synthase family protein [Sporocytophaga sp.]|uniref:beta-ketoacyl-[acyl-carrier-protein] synthase family protein n=1 Tax=Sporocytophaga sp. TaxID=2231183 RepID=UPI001B1269FF|nr:beta-ketoacyl synthase N-terminal-like domain-containing protein [Sporocytophaga sp.]MBO9700286.1 beta-ketoacyl-[acyl-carrier-protein] synthase family protein [Sporocytophaga sp.]
MKSVFLISDNVITSLGFNTGENAAKMRERCSGVLLSEDHFISPTPFYASLVKTPILEESFGRLNSKEGYTRLEKMIITSISDALNKTKIDPASNDTLFIISTAKGNIDLLENKYKERVPKERLKLAVMARVISSFFKNPNQPLVISNACISGSVAILLGKRILNEGKYRNVIVAGGDVISEFTVSGFQSFKAIGSGPCKPYDEGRDGISLGEGAGTVILSVEPENNTSIAVIGGAITNDANHISGPSRTGEGLFLAIDGALKDASICAEEIDYISGHGTATNYNDEMESKAIHSAKLELVPMNSLKGYIGHTLGAAGIAESVMAAYSMKNNILFATAGFSKMGVTQPVNVLSDCIEKKVNRVLKTAAGFGGCNAALIFEKQ